MSSITIRSLFEQYSSGRRDFRGMTVTSEADWMLPQFAELSALILDEAHLEGIHFRSADLRESSFARSSLVDVDLSNSVLIGTTFSEADIRSSNLQGAACYEANFESSRIDAKLSNVTMTDARLSRAILTGLQATDAIFTSAELQQTVMTKCDFSNSTFDNADLTGSDLRESNFSKVTFKEANLSDCRAESANFHKAILEGADVQGISLVGATLDGANLYSLEWLNSDLSRASMRRVELESSSFRSCSLTEVDATFASLASTVMVGCNLNGINLTNARLSNCIWKNVVLESATVEGADLAESTLLEISARNTGFSQEQRQSASIDKSTFQSLPPLAAGPKTIEQSDRETDPDLTMMFKVREQTETSIVRVYYATDRKPVKKGYGPDRGDGLRYGTCDVSIPRDHRMGALEAPSIWKLQISWDDKKHVMIEKLAEQGPARFFGQLKHRVTASEDQGAFLFVHGYNVPFEDAIRRAGQLAYDLSFDGPPIAYSWASQGDPKLYTFDEASVEDTIPRLKTFIEQVAARTDVRRLHIVAHSMGNRAVSRVMQEFSLDAAKAVRLSHVVLAAPDVDAGVFKGISAQLAASAEQVTLYASSNDLAIQASKRVHGYRRAGEGGRHITLSDGISTIDASGLDTNLLGHSYFADHTSVVSDIFYLLRDNPPQKRFGLRKAKAGKREYWIFRLEADGSGISRLIRWCKIRLGFSE